MRLRSVLAATALAGAIAALPILVQNAAPSLHSLLDETGLGLLPIPPVHAERG